jgi:hypothetical protein
MALHLSSEYQEGYDSLVTENPYDFFDDAMKHTAWCYGKQKRTLEQEGK